MISILYNISCSMEKLGKPFSIAALLCGGALLFLASCTTPGSTQTTTPKILGFTLVTCVQEVQPEELGTGTGPCIIIDGHHICEPTVANVDPPRLDLEECVFDSRCGDCITALLGVTDVELTLETPARAFTHTHTTTEVPGFGLVHSFGLLVSPVIAVEFNN